MAARQAEMLAALWPLLARGGRLLYATCTVSRRENQAQIEAFLAATSDARIAAAPRQIYPGDANMDGFYYACLDKSQMS